MKNFLVLFQDLGGVILGMSSLRQSNLFGTVFGQKEQKSNVNEHVQPKPKIPRGGPIFKKVKIWPILDTIFDNIFDTVENKSSA